MRIRLFILFALTLSIPACGGSSSGTGPAQSENKPKKEHPQVVIETSMGTIKAELFINDAPKTVENFLTYVDDKFFDGTVFHRVIPDFMIQGGGFEPGVEKAKTPEQFQAKEKKARDPIQNESTNGLSNDRGTLAMARTPHPHSASAQFFINVNDNLPLNRDMSRDGWGYAVFGKVTEGMEVVDKIKNVETITIFPGVSDVPAEPVIIKSIRRVEKEPKE